MPLAPWDEAGLLNTGERLYDLGWYSGTLLVSARAQVLKVDEEPIPMICYVHDGYLMPDGEVKILTAEHARTL